MVFNVSSSTLFLSAKDGSNLALKDLAAGMTFTAFHSAATTRSLPPQSALHTMIVVANSNEDFAHDFTVQDVESSSNGLDLLNDKGDTILHVSSSTNVYTLGETGLEMCIRDSSNMQPLAVAGPFIPQASSNIIIA